jgi:hypothetical protein
MRQTASCLSLPSAPVDVSYVTELNEDQIRECQWSTLDLCAPNAFTLILGTEDTQLVSQLAHIREYCRVMGVAFNSWHLGTEFNIVRQRWFSTELNNSGVLVRPDQHIMIKVTEETTGDKLIAILSSHLGK